MTSCVAETGLGLIAAVESFATQAFTIHLGAGLRGFDCAEVEPGDLDCLSASASGRVEINRREVLGVARALAESAADLSVAAVRVLLGEAFGAAGGLQVVALLGTPANGALPGISGLDQVERGLPIGGLAASAHSTVRASRRALVTALSPDGHAAAPALGAAPGGGG